MANRYEDYERWTEIKQEKLADWIQKIIQRQEILINNRVNWILTFQGFLFATFALSINNNIQVPVIYIFRYVIPLLGIIISLAGILGLIGAYKVIDEQAEQLKGSNLYELSSPTGMSNTALFFGRIPSFGILICMVVTWVVIITIIG